tara:strand:- start:160 stop:564 length:405 start_codon:yes stop_codon:yes gene_type:complete
MEYGLNINKQFLFFLKAIGIHYLNNNDFMTCEHQRKIHQQLNYYIVRVVCETNQYISLIINFEENLIEIDIYMVSSLGWGELFYSLPAKIKEKIRDHINQCKLPYTLSQFGFFEHNKINNNISCLKELEKKLNL